MDCVNVNGVAVGIMRFCLLIGASCVLPTIAGLQLSPNRFYTTRWHANHAITPRLASIVCVDSGEQPQLQERLRLFQRLAVPYFERADGAKENFALLLLLVLIKSGIAVGLSYVSRDFFSALSARDQALFLEKTAYYAAYLVVATPLTALYTFQRRRLSLNWREWMTTELARQYYSDNAYYRLETDSPPIDNPDQRITEDVRTFTAVSLDFTVKLANALIDLLSFSGILYSIYPDLFYCILLYASVGTLTTVQLGRSLIGQNAEQLLREADLRYALVRLRENAESVAFYRGEAQEAAGVGERLQGAVNSKRRVLSTQRDLEYFTVAYKYLIQILPVLVVSPLYFSGAVELGVITQVCCALRSRGRPRPLPACPTGDAQSRSAFNHVRN